MPSVLEQLDALDALLPFASDGRPDRPGCQQTRNPCARPRPRLSLPRQMVKDASCEPSSPTGFRSPTTAVSPSAGAASTQHATAQKALPQVPASPLPPGTATALDIISVGSESDSRSGTPTLSVKEEEEEEEEEEKDDDDGDSDGEVTFLSEASTSRASTKVTREAHVKSEVKPERLQDCLPKNRDRGKSKQTRLFSSGRAEQEAGEAERSAIPAPRAPQDLPVGGAWRVVYEDGADAGLDGPLGEDDYDAYPSENGSDSGRYSRPRGGESGFRGRHGGVYNRTSNAESSSGGGNGMSTIGSGASASRIRAPAALEHRTNRDASGGPSRGRGLGAARGGNGRKFAWKRKFKKRARSKSAARGSSLRAIKNESKPAVQRDVKSSVKREVKPVIKREAKPVIKRESKPAVKREH